MQAGPPARRARLLGAARPRRRMMRGNIARLFRPRNNVLALLQAGADCGVGDSDGGPVDSESDPANLVKKQLSTEGTEGILVSSVMRYINHNRI